MSAFDEFLSLLKNNLSAVEKFRDNLVYSGNIGNGNFPKYMKIVQTKGKKDEKEIKEISAFNCSSRDYGFVFDKTGTEMSLDFISKDIPLVISGELSNCFLFQNSDNESLWTDCSVKTKKRLIASNLSEMMKKMNVNYRTLGDRCHYFSVGRIEVIEKDKDKDNIYPLFIFPCEDIDEKKQSAKIDQHGFLNFVVDKNKLHNRLIEILNANQIDAKQVFIDDNFCSSISNVIEADINNLSIPNLDIKCECSVSSLTIITGFKAEYLDPAWDRILREYK